MKKKANKWAARLTAFLLAGAVAFGAAAATGPTTVQAAADNPLITDATRTGSLTIVKHGVDGNTNLGGATFSIYKVMSLEASTTPGTYVDYQVVPAFATALDSVDPDKLGNYSAAEIEKLIGDLKSVADGLPAATATATTAETTGAAVFSNLALGYYLVVETQAPDGYVAGSPFLIAIPSTNNYADAPGSEGTPGTTWVYNVTAEPKNVQVSIDKKLAAGEDGSVGVGDYVKYVVTSKIPNYKDEYFKEGNNVVFILTDKMCAGLEIVNDTNDTEHLITVKVDGEPVTPAGDTYSVETHTKADIETTTTLNDLKVDFAQEYIKANRDKAVELTYYAKVTANAVTGTDGNDNGVKLTYNHKPGTIADPTNPDPDAPDNPTTTTPEKEVKVYSFNINVIKFTNATTSTTLLKDAKFELYSDATLTTKVREGMTDGNGSLSFAKLDEGTYYLKETRAPKGYTLLANPIKVEIIAEENADGVATTGEFTLKINGKTVDEETGTYVSYRDQRFGTAYVAVENYKGFTLPTTGGIGVTIFLLTGAAGIVALSVLMTRKTKKNA